MDFWEWFTLVTGIMGGVAFLMAIQPFLHTIWGRPRISFIFHVEDMEKQCYYGCEIHNDPIKNKLLRKLGIRRDLAQDVAATFEIREKGTNKLICPRTPALIKTSQGVGGFRVSLPASFFPATFAIVFIDKANKTVQIMRDDKIVMTMGDYTATIQVVVGEDRFVGKCNFVIDSKHPFVYWDVKN